MSSPDASTEPFHEQASGEGAAPRLARESPLAELLRKRVVLVTGKGGVGRSSVTAAIATVAARRKVRVLVTEIGEVGSEHSPLARLFGRERLPDAAETIAPGILGGLLLSHQGQTLFLTSVLRVKALARAALSSEALRRLLSAAPSFREMGIYYHLLTYLKERLPSGEPVHELILVDMPATGHALALTGLPEVLLRLVGGGPIAAALREGQAYLNDPKTGSAYVVTLPETLPVSEALELLDGLAKTKMPVGGVILNRMPEDPFTPAEREALRPIMEKRALYGAEGYSRCEDCRRAVSRLREEISVPLVTLPESREDGPGLVEVMAAALDAERSS